jgi:hypothetical protein
MPQPALRATAAALSPAPDGEPGHDECLRCYLMRMMEQSGCDGSYRWTLRWQSARAPRVSGLDARLRRQGGCCDCEVVFNIMPDYPEADGILPCAGVPDGCTRPCDLDAAAGQGPAGRAGGG